jgi:sugar lactone lactonase YvrE
MIKKSLFSLLAILVVYLLAWPVDIDPVAWQAPENLGYTQDFAQNQQLSQLHRIELDGAIGPEDYALDAQQNIYFSLLSGDIKYMDSSGVIHDWINTGGRPLGIEFDAQGNLIVADALKGLLKIDVNGRIETLVTRVDGIDVNYADDVDISNNGKIYFSDASTKFHAKKYRTYGASLLDINEHGGHGRLIEYDPKTKKAVTLASGFNFANGVTMTHDNKWVLMNETGHYRILKIAVVGDNRGKFHVLIDGLPGFPDNINQGSNGLYWFGMVSPRSKVLDMLSGSGFARKIVQRLPLFLRPKAQHFGHVVAIDDEGVVKHNLQDPLGIYGQTTGALEVGDQLYISSLHETALAKTLNPNFLQTKVITQE